MTFYHWQHPVFLRLSFLMPHPASWMDVFSFDLKHLFSLFSRVSFFFHEWIFEYLSLEISRLVSNNNWLWNTIRKQLDTIRSSRNDSSVDAPLGNEKNIWNRSTSTSIRRSSSRSMGRLDRTSSFFCWKSVWTRKRRKEFECGSSLCLVNTPHSFSLWTSHLDLLLSFARARLESNRSVFRRREEEVRLTSMIVSLMDRIGWTNWILPSAEDHACWKSRISFRRQVF